MRGMTTSQITLCLRYTVGDGWFIIERDESCVFPSTGTNERVISGPWIGLEQAVDERAKIAAAFDQDGCEGHPAGPFDPMGQTVYCDGSCVS